MRRWVEIAADFRCNSKCIGCFSSGGSHASMTTAEIVQHITRQRQQGTDSLWLGGGEPTIRKDLLSVIRAARGLGYSRIKLQTNGMRLAYPRFAEACIGAGVTEVALTILGPTADAHDHYARTPSAFAFLLQGLANVRALGASLEGDILVYRDTSARLSEAVRVFHGLGIGSFRIWMLSCAGLDRNELAALMPRASDVARNVQAAMDLRLADRTDFILSLHTPPCTVAPSYHACLFNAADLSLWIINPGEKGFALEDSPIEGGSFLKRCAECSLRKRCNGLRRDYLEHFGSDEFQPVQSQSR